MKKIMYAKIIPTSTTDMQGRTVEFALGESSEAEYGEEWDGNVEGYVENQDLPEDVEIGGEHSGSIHNLPEGAIVLTMEGRPVEAYWAE